MRSLALALCAACAASSPRPASVRVIESTERAPDWTRTTKAGSVISRDLLTAVELSYPDISRDGKYYSMVRAGEGELYVGRIGVQPRLLLACMQYAWIGEHSLI